MLCIQISCCHCKCEMVLVLLDSTRNGQARDACFMPGFCLGFTWRQRREKLRATSYLQNFSSCHACALHSKCLQLLVASYDQSMNSRLHLLRGVVSHQTWYACSLWLAAFVSYTSGLVVARKLLAALPKPGVIFRCFSTMLSDHHSPCRLVLLCNAKETMGPCSAWKKSVMTRLSGEYSHSTHSNFYRTVWLTNFNFEASSFRKGKIINYSPHLWTMFI